MATLEKKVKTALSESFAKREFEVETLDDGRISGSIISKQFIDKDNLTRQRKIWAALRKKLTKAEQHQVLGILAYTPEENEAYSNGVTYSTRRKPIKGLEKKVKNILLNLFAESELKLETEPDGRVSGFVISDKFIDVEALECQRMIWKLLRPNITKSERSQIIGFLTFTPMEYEVYSEQDFS